LFRNLEEVCEVGKCDDCINTLMHSHLQSLRQFVEQRLICPDAPASVCNPSLDKAAVVEGREDIGGRETEPGIGIRRQKKLRINPFVQGI